MSVRFFGHRKPIGVRNQPLPAGVLMSCASAVQLQAAVMAGSKHATACKPRKYKDRKRRSR